MRSLQLNGKALKQVMENLLEARIIVAEEKKNIQILACLIGSGVGSENVATNL